MTLETKLSYVNGKCWNHRTALECWTRYHNLYTDKHKNALFHAQVSGNYYKYIEKECNTFRRYAQMWKYQRDLK